jgi:hypothetical protein
MVQVDIFWSYSIGAGFAMAASRQLIAEHKENKSEGTSAFDSPFFSRALIFLSVVFAPSGICLLWAFTSWETMHVFTYDTLPAWLVTLFAITNITQGMLGYWITRNLLVRNAKYLAHMQMLIGYFFMFFILVHGWDGTGYQRFFSYQLADFQAWNVSFGLWNTLAWLVSPVALTLYLMGAILIPWMMGLTSKWIIEGIAADDTLEISATEISQVQVVKQLLLYVFAFGLGMAIVASLLIHLFGWLIGLFVFALAAYFIVLRTGGLLHKFIGNMLYLPADYQ